MQLTLTHKPTHHPSTRVLHHPRTPHQQTLHSFPTRRSSNLDRNAHAADMVDFDGHPVAVPDRADARRRAGGDEIAGIERRDRKSTRLNSSHANISYAVFCLKKKMNENIYESVLRITLYLNGI